MASEIDARSITLTIAHARAIARACRPLAPRGPIAIRQTFALTDLGRQTSLIEDQSLAKCKTYLETRAFTRLAAIAGLRIGASPGPILLTTNTRRITRPPSGPLRPSTMAGAIAHLDLPSIQALASCSSLFTRAGTSSTLAIFIAALLCTRKPFAPL